MLSPLPCRLARSRRAEFPSFGHLLTVHPQVPHGFLLGPVACSPYLSFIPMLEGLLTRPSRGHLLCCLDMSLFFSEHFLPFGTVRYPRHFLWFLCPVMESAVSPRIPGSFWWEMELRGQDLNGECLLCHRCHCSPRLLCVCTRACASVLQTQTSYCVFRSR